MAMIPVHRQDAAEDGGATPALAERILDAALERAEEVGWEAVELSVVAARLGIPAYRVLEHYRDLDAVANAWFLRGWRGMLADKPEGFSAWPARARVEYCLLAWFDALIEHRRVTVQMLRTKAHPPHAHTWVPMIFDLSRTIQWLREAARLEAPYGTRRAQVEEIGLTALFLDILRLWAGDDSPGQRRTRAALRRRLGVADLTLRWCVPRSAMQHAGPSSSTTMTDAP